MEPMVSARLRSRAVALIAAYAVAMQAMLSAALPTVAIADPLAVLCAHDGTGDKGAPAGHDRPCAAICAAIGHGVAGAPLPQVFAVMASLQTPVGLVVQSDWRPPAISIRGPQAPRGPPLA